tara:strand:- start:192 stop:620 length:429 start_codon:yes stop_codon:yes gene_type:complete
MFTVNEKELRKSCKPCDHREGRIIGERLLEMLSQTTDGVGLAANQVGIDKRVCVVKVNKPIVLINPKIVGKFGKSYFQEGCLSFPGKVVITERWTSIVVDTSNHPQMIFSFEKDPLECVCVQHEIDHLNGVVMFDRAVDDWR